jgi:SAM-dependent methyltransferase
MTGIVQKTKGVAYLVLERVGVPFFAKWYNKRFCSMDGMWEQYFSEAEAAMAKSWTKIIWPLIEDFDFDTVLELAPGAGRNTAKLIQVARVIHAVDMNEYALRRLRARFQSVGGQCELHIHQNQGNDLATIPDGSITFIYSWDSAVHFDKAVLKDYVSEFSRVLRPNGAGFIHHSNLGDRGHVDIRRNPHWRSNMSKELFADYCCRYGLRILKQVDLPWPPIVDCLSVFHKSSTA